MEESVLKPGAGKEDLTLMREIAQGDGSALKVFYDRHAGVVFALLMRMLGDRSEAEQLLTDVFFEIWRSGSRYDELRSNPLTYLMRITRSRAIDRLRLKSPVGIRGASLDVGKGIDVAVTDSPGSAMEAAERRAQVSGALAALEGDQRRAIECAFFEGLSHQEISQKLDKPLGTVKSTIRLGLVRLKEILSRSKDKGAMQP